MGKVKNKKKIDIEARLFMVLLHLKEEKNKKYSVKECEKNIAYLFDNYAEFKTYFELNGFSDISEDLLETCRMKTTKKGTIIALKGLCDYAIRQHNFIYSNITDLSSEDKKKEILFKDYPSLHITEETRQAILEHPELHSGLSVRTRMGRIYTDEEWERRREEVLSRPLPGGEEKSPTLVKKRKLTNPKDKK